MAETSHLSHLTPKFLRAPVLAITSAGAASVAYARTAINTISGPKPRSLSCGSPYEPVGDGEFRLVQIFPSSRLDGGLSCVVKNVKMSTAMHTYTAVSYTWGSDIKDHSIWWHNRELRVTKSCYLACEQYLRTWPPESGYLEIGPMVMLPTYRGTGWLFVDQLCIDQMSPTEKGPQVRLMGDIYAGAEDKMVWLGRPDEPDFDFTHQAKNQEEVEMLETMLEKQGMLEYGVYSRDSTQPMTVAEVSILKGYLLCLSIATFAENNNSYLRRKLRLSYHYHMEAMRAAAKDQVPQDTQHLLEGDKFCQYCVDHLAENGLTGLDDLLKDEDAWHGLRGILYRRDQRSAYFRRKWIVQELSIPVSDSAFMYVANFRFPMDTFVEGLWSIGQTNISAAGFAPLRTLIKPGVLDHFIASLGIELQLAWFSYNVIRRQVLGEPWNIQYYLDNCSPFECLDDRDAFFSIRSQVTKVGLDVGLEDEDDDERPFPEHLIPPLPDYLADIRSVLTQYVTYVLVLGNAINMVQRSGLQNGSQKLDKLPTWYPSWLPGDETTRPWRYIVDLTDDLETCNAYSGGSRLDDLDEADADALPKYHNIAIHAGRKAKQSARWTTDATLLVLRGLIIGKITDFRSTSSTLLTQPQSLRSSAESYGQEISDGDSNFIRERTCISSTTDRLTQMYASKFSISNKQFVELRAPDEDEDHEYQFVGNHDVLQEYLYNALAGERQTSESPKLSKIMLHRSLISLSVEGALVPHFLGINAEETSGDGLEMQIVGIGPGVAEVGDVVVVFDGSATPMVLRMTSEVVEDIDQNSAISDCIDMPTYQVVGDAHFLQLANGEVSSQADSRLFHDIVLV